MLAAGAAFWLMTFGLTAYQFPHYVIPGDSMAPAIAAKDRVVTERYSRGWASPGVRPLPPRRGDVVAFRLPDPVNTVYMKRVVGLPGDQVQLRGGRVFLNGTALAVEPLADGDDEEILPDGVRYTVRDSRPGGPYDDTPEWTVPPGHYFVLGDNRDHSRDSRSMDRVGFVAEDRLIGCVTLRYYNGRTGAYDPVLLTSQPLHSRIVWSAAR